MSIECRSKPNCNIFWNFSVSHVFIRVIVPSIYALHVLIKIGCFQSTPLAQDTGCVVLLTTGNNCSCLFGAAQSTGAGAH